MLSPSDILKKAKFDEINDARRGRRRTYQACLPNSNQNNWRLLTKACGKKKAILADDKDSCIQADIEFHLNVAKAANHEVLLLLYQGFTEMITDFSTKESQKASAFAMSYHLHEQLYVAIRDKKKNRQLKFLIIY